MIRAAKALNCKPWELEDVPVRWQKAVFWLEYAEVRAQELDAKIRELKLKQSAKEDA